MTERVNNFNQTVLRHDKDCQQDVDSLCHLFLEKINASSSFDERSQWSKTYQQAIAMRRNWNDKIVGKIGLVASNMQHLEIHRVMSLLRLILDCVSRVNASSRNSDRKEILVKIDIVVSRIIRAHRVSVDAFRAFIFLKFSEILTNFKIQRGYLFISVISSLYMSIMRLKEQQVNRFNYVILEMKKECAQNTDKAHYLFTKKISIVEDFESRSRWNKIYQRVLELKRKWNTTVEEKTTELFFKIQEYIEFNMLKFVESIDKYGMSYFDCSEIKFNSQKEKSLDDVIGVIFTITRSVISEDNFQIFIFELLSKILKSQCNFSHFIQRIESLLENQPTLCDALFSQNEVVLMEMLDSSLKKGCNAYRQMEKVFRIFQEDITNANTAEEANLLVRDLEDSCTLLFEGLSLTMEVMPSLFDQINRDLDNNLRFTLEANVNNIMRLKTECLFIQVDFILQQARSSRDRALLREQDKLNIALINKNRIKLYERFKDILIAHGASVEVVLEYLKHSSGRLLAVQPSVDWKEGRIITNSIRFNGQPFLT